MTKWLEYNKKIVLIILLVLFMVLALFYFFLIRPLAAEEKNLQEQLKRISDDTSFYQNAIDQLNPQSFTDEEKLLLVGSVPGRPNVEEVIKDLEKNELETGVAIENITFSTNSKGSDQEKVNRIAKQRQTFKKVKRPQPTSQFNSRDLAVGSRFFPMKL